MTTFTLTGTFTHQNGITPISKSPIHVQADPFPLGSSVQTDRVEKVTDANGTVTFTLTTGVTGLYYVVRSTAKRPLFKPIRFLAPAAGTVLDIKTLIFYNPGEPPIEQDLIALRDSTQGYAAQAQGAVSLLAWAPTTAYTIGDIRQSPTGTAIRSNSTRTSRATYDATEAGNWTAVATPGLTYYAMDNGVVNNAAVDQAPALNALIASVPVGSVIELPPVMSVGSAIEILTEAVTLVGSSRRGGTLIKCLAGFTDSQMVRNWKSTDWQAGRTQTSVGVTNGSTAVTTSSAATTDIGKVFRGAPGYVGGVQPGTTITAATAGVGYTLSLAYQGPTGSITATLGEPDHFFAPIFESWGVYYMGVRDIDFDINGHSNVTCVGRVHPAENAVVENVSYRDIAGGGSGNVGRADFANATTAHGNGIIAGPIIAKHEVQYSKTWKHMIYVDGGNNLKLVTSKWAMDGGQVQEACTYFSDSSAPANGPAYTHSPFVYIASGAVNIREAHNQGQPANTTVTLSAVGTISAAAGGGAVFTATLTLTDGHLFEQHWVGCGVSDLSTPSNIPTDAYIASVGTGTTANQVTLQASTAFINAAAQSVNVGADSAFYRIRDCKGIWVQGSDVVPTAASPTNRPAYRNTQSTWPGGIQGRYQSHITHMEIGAGSAWTDGQVFLEDYAGGTVKPVRIMWDSATFKPTLIHDYNGARVTYNDANGLTQIESTSGLSGGHGFATVVTASVGGWAIPAGARKLRITAVAGGGGGGGSAGSSPTQIGATGGGGGSGQVNVQTIDVGASQTLNITVGAAGTAGTAGTINQGTAGGAGGQGGTTTVTNPVTGASVTAAGGAGGAGGALATNNGASGGCYGGPGTIATSAVTGCGGAGGGSNSSGGRSGASVPAGGSGGGGGGGANAGTASGNGGVAGIAFGSSVSGGTAGGGTPAGNAAAANSGAGGGGAGGIQTVASTGAVGAAGGAGGSGYALIEVVG